MRARDASADTRCVCVCVWCAGKVFLALKPSTKLVQEYNKAAKQVGQDERERGSARMMRMRRRRLMREEERC
eukprot:3072570-Rhodomonas_salina.2